VRALAPIGEIAADEQHDGLLAESEPGARLGARPEELEAFSRGCGR